MLAVTPRTTEQVAADPALVPGRGREGRAARLGHLVVGSALPLGAVRSSWARRRFNKVLEIDYADRLAVVQPGVTNLAVTKAVEAEGFYYAPDPSSQIACSIGGNVAENSGGVHCLKYGLTTNNVLGVEMVLMDGEVVRLGGRERRSRRGWTCWAWWSGPRACSGWSPRSPCASSKSRRRRGPC